jgi:DNA-binding GntR family transcriptional regulator
VSSHDPDKQEAEVTSRVPNQEARRNHHLQAVDSSSRTLHSRIAQQLRDAITSGSLAPGERLRTQELAEELGVSRIPVRETLHTLQAEGLVEFHPHRGAVVASFSSDEIVEVFLLRSLLEPAAARLAVARNEDGLSAHLGHLIDQMETAEDDPSRWIDLDKEFHATLYQASGHPMLCQLIERLRASIERYVRIYILAPRNIPLSRIRHREIYTACCTADATLAERVMREHLAEVEEIFLDELHIRLDTISPDKRSDGS